MQAGKTERMLLGIGYAIGRKPSRPDQVEIFRSASGLKVYFNPDAAPRVWAVHAIDRIAPDQMPFQWGRGVAELRARAFMKDAPPRVESCSDPESVALVSREAGRVGIEAELACTGLVVSGDAFFPGWHATVDDRAAPIYEVYGALRGIVVPAGRHRIEMVYRPLSVLLGAAASAGGLLLALVCARGGVQWRGAGFD